MHSATQEFTNLSDEELSLVAELLNTERTKLLVEIRHTDRRTYREELKQRLATVEKLLARCHPE